MVILCGTMLGYVSVVLLGLDVTIIANVNCDAAVQVSSTHNLLFIYH